MDENTIPRKETNAKELHTIEYLAALHKRLEVGEKPLEGRLRSIPDAWRQFRIALSATSKSLDLLYNSIPVDTLIHLDKMAKCGEVHIRPVSSLNRKTDMQPVLDVHLKTLVNTSMSSQCAVCLKEGRDIKKCELRKALLHAAPPSQIGHSKLCEYVEVANNCELGDYI